MKLQKSAHRKHDEIGNNELSARINEPRNQKNVEYFCRDKKNVYLCSRFRGVAQLVALLVWDQAVARSSRVAPTAELGKEPLLYEFFSVMAP